MMHTGQDSFAMREECFPDPPNLEKMGSFTIQASVFTPELQKEVDNVAYEVSDGNELLADRFVDLHMAFMHDHISVREFWDGLIHTFGGDRMVRKVPQLLRLFPERSKKHFISAVAAHWRKKHYAPSGSASDTSLDRKGLEYIEDGSDQLNNHFGPTMESAAPVEIDSSPEAIVDVRIDHVPLAQASQLVSLLSTLLDINIGQSKQIVQTIPVYIRNGIHADEAMSLKHQLEATGALVSVLKTHKSITSSGYESDEPSVWQSVMPPKLLGRATHQSTKGDDRESAIMQSSTSITPHPPVKYGGEPAPRGSMRKTGTVATSASGVRGASSFSVNVSDETSQNTTGPEMAEANEHRHGQDKEIAANISETEDLSELEARSTEDEVSLNEVRSHCSLVLLSVESGKLLSVMHAIRGLRPALTFKEIKALVQSAPVRILDLATLTEAELYVEKLWSAGAEVSIEGLDSSSGNQHKSGTVSDTTSWEYPGQIVEENNQSKRSLDSEQKDHSEDGSIKKPSFKAKIVMDTTHIYAGDTNTEGSDNATTEENADNDDLSVQCIRAAASKCKLPLTGIEKPIDFDDEQHHGAVDKSLRTSSSSRMDSIGIAEENKDQSLIQGEASAVVQWSDVAAGTDSSVMIDRETLWSRSNTEDPVSHQSSMLCTSDQAASITNLQTSSKKDEQECKLENLPHSTRSEVLAPSVSTASQGAPLDNAGFDSRQQASSSEQNEQVTVPGLTLAASQTEESLRSRFLSSMPGDDNHKSLWRANADQVDSSQSSREQQLRQNTTLEKEAYIPSGAGYSEENQKYTWQANDPLSRGTDHQTQHAYERQRGDSYPTFSFQGTNSMISYDPDIQASFSTTVVDIDAMAERSEGLNPFTNLLYPSQNVHNGDDNDSVEVDIVHQDDIPSEHPSTIPVSVSQASDEISTAKAYHIQLEAVSDFRDAIAHVLTSFNKSLSKEEALLFCEIVPLIVAYGIPGDQALLAKTKLEDLGCSVTVSEARDTDNIAGNDSVASQEEEDETNRYCVTLLRVTDDETTAETMCVLIEMNGSLPGFNHDPTKPLSHQTPLLVARDLSKAEAKSIVALFKDTGATASYTVDDGVGQSSMTTPPNQSSTHSASSNPASSFNEVNNNSLSHRLRAGSSNTIESDHQETSGGQTTVDVHLSGVRPGCEARVLQALHDILPHHQLETLNDYLAHLPVQILKCIPSEHGVIICQYLETSGAAMFTSPSTESSSFIGTNTQQIPSTMGPRASELESQQHRQRQVPVHGTVTGDNADIESVCRGCLAVVPGSNRHCLFCGCECDTRLRGERQRSSSAASMVSSASDLSVVGRHSLRQASSLHQTEFLCSVCSNSLGNNHSRCANCGSYHSATSATTANGVAAMPPSDFYREIIFTISGEANQVVQQFFDLLNRSGPDWSLSWDSATGSSGILSYRDILEFKFSAIPSTSSPSNSTNLHLTCPSTRVGSYSSADVFVRYSSVCRAIEENYRYLHTLENVQRLA